MLGSCPERTLWILAAYLWKVTHFTAAEGVMLSLLDKLIYHRLNSIEIEIQY